MEQILNEKDKRLFDIKMYIKCKFLLLGDVFEKFRYNSSNNFGLCPSNYLGASSLIWQKLSLNLFKILTFKYSLKKVWEVEFLIFLIDIVRPTKSIWILWPKTKMKTYYVNRRITYYVMSMAMECLSFFQQQDSNG